MTTTTQQQADIHVSLECDSALYLTYGQDLYAVESESARSYTFRKCCEGGEVNTVAHAGGKAVACSCKGYQWGTRRTGRPCRHQQLATFLLGRW